MAKVTIETISRHTGLSRGTISRALNDRPDISAATRQRVLEVCRQLNYSPSHAARALATGRSFALAAFVDTLDSHLITSILHGAIEQATQAGYVISLMSIGDANAELAPAARSVVERLDGTLWLSSRQPTGSLLEAIEERPMASVRPLADITHDVVGPDEIESGRLLARRLLRSEGELLYVHSPEHDPDGRRMAGFQELCAERGASLQTVETREDGLHMDLLNAMKRVSAVGCSDDFTATRVLTTAIATDGKDRIGRDFLIGGQGNEVFGPNLAPSLTTVDLSGLEIGRRAIQLLVHRVQGERSDAPEPTRVAPVLIARQSG